MMSRASRAALQRTMTTRRHMPRPKPAQTRTRNSTSPGACSACSASAAAAAPSDDNHDHVSRRARNLLRPRLASALVTPCRSHCPYRSHLRPIPVLSPFPSPFPSPSPSLISFPFADPLSRRLNALLLHPAPPPPPSLLPTKPLSRLLLIPLSLSLSLPFILPLRPYTIVVIREI